jgi:N-acetylmuramoyl-L-alanine amidase
LTNHRTSTGSLLLLASFLVLPALSLPSFASSRARTTQAFDRASAMRDKLAAKPEKERKTSDYRVLILAFHSVYRLDPGFGKAPVALEDIAELYREMGRVFSESRYFNESIKAYEFLMKEYPTYSGSREAPLNIGDVYIVDLRDPQQAREWIQKFLDKYPRSQKAADARARLAAINRALESKPPAEATASSLSVGSDLPPGEMPQVTDIRHWVGPHYTRIVIGLNGGEAKFETLRLSHPDRIVLDLLDTKLSPSLAGMKFPLEDGFLRQVRVGQFTPDVTRVVLDVEKVQDYFIFPLPNPFRLVVDVHGPPDKPGEKTAVAKEGAPEQEKTSEGSAVASKTQPPAAPGKSAPAPASAKPSAGNTAASIPESPSRTSGAESATGLKTTQVASMPGTEILPARPAKPTSAGSRTLTRALGLKIGRIVIDPGHGGHDTGTIGPTGLEEKDVVLDVALRLAKLLRDDAGSDVVLTRTTDTFIPLEERTAIANEKAADLFISIHANSSRDREARGVETYYLNFTSDPGALEVAARENATSQESVHQLRDLIKKIALTEKVEESHEFAMDVQRQLYRRLERATGKQKDRGVKKAPFVVLIGANMPSILAEISFLSNPSDERLLRRPDYRQKIAESLYRGVLNYAQNLGGIKVAQRGAPIGHP